MFRQRFHRQAGEFGSRIGDGSIEIIFASKFDEQLRSEIILFLHREGCGGRESFLQERGYGQSRTLMGIILTPSTAPHYPPTTVL